MNSRTNLELVEEFGDKVQLNYGKEFGYFANRITDEQLMYFCEDVNITTFAVLKGYHLSVEFYNDMLTTSRIFLKNYYNNLCVEVKLLDHTVFINATNAEWRKIERTIFEIILKVWRKFLSKHIPEYKEHFNNTLVLDQQNNIYTIK